MVLRILTVWNVCSSFTSGDRFSKILLANCEGLPRTKCAKGESKYFHQILLRLTIECTRLSVVFHGEEGIDAGGVTREWYSVLAREIFNENYALFRSTHDGML